LSNLTTALYSGKQVSRAGDLLLDDNLAKTKPGEYDQAMDILAYWRACHEEPLVRAHKLVKTAISNIDRRAVTASRLKRIPSIIKKLQRFDSMTLRSMQDIGGCRAILKNQKTVLKAFRALRDLKQLRVKNYLKVPKDDGYRGIHLIGDFSAKGEQKRSIEIQLRTKIQHSWATAVEIIDLFTGQAIKSNRGQEDWKKFFRVISRLFLLLEEIPNVDETSINKSVQLFIDKLNAIGRDSSYNEVIADLEEIYKLANKLKITDNFRAFAASLKITDDHCGKDAYDGYVILEIDILSEKLALNRFHSNHFDDAAAYYLKIEKTIKVDSGKVVVLVSTDAVNGLKEAYPNYFADSATFLHLLKICIDVYKVSNPSKISRTIKKIFSK
jgi:ppGpp synthetase/RelA/SpoT-type nucleotidyltranferase